MRRGRTVASTVIGAALSLGLGLVGSLSGALAADLPVKAPPPKIGPSYPFDVHGYFDLTFANGRVTPGGLRLYPNRGVLTQPEIGLSLDIYKNPAGFINQVSLFGGIWSESWSDPPPGGRNWQEVDWWAGVGIKFAQYWRLDVQHLEFMFPPGLGTMRMVTSTLGYSDAHWGFPIAFNPYVSLFYEYEGPSTVALGKNGDTYRVEIGVKPTFGIEKYTGIPLTFTFPTWVMLGPSDYWNRNDGTTNFCGTTSTLPCSSGNSGVVSTGIQAKLSLAAWIPQRLGSWYLKGGVQYYHITNDTLLGAQIVTGAAASFPDAKEDVWIVNGGVGFTF
jgi:hypothetical protein